MLNKHLLTVFFFYLEHLLYKFLWMGFPIEMNEKKDLLKVMLQSSLFPLRRISRLWPTYISWNVFTVSQYGSWCFSLALYIATGQHCKDKRCIFVFPSHQTYTSDLWKVSETFYSLRGQDWWKRGVLISMSLELDLWNRWFVFHASF